ncbi:MULTISPECIES: BspA family leucine-rich repeat surface protein [Chitinophagaceae]
MKKNLQFFFLCLTIMFLSSKVHAQNEFITQWDTRLTSSTGTASSTNATIVFGSQGTNYTISYAEVGGSGYTGTLTGQGNTPAVTFPEPGVYTVKMGPTGLTGYTSDYLAAPYYYNKGLLAIQQWGTTHWTNLVSGFYNASRMDVTATDVPDLSGVTSLSGLFFGDNALTNANGSISGWNTSTITGMGFLFRECYVFNQPLNSWDVSHVTNMSQTFARAYAFNQPLNSWNTSNVTDLSYTFFEADAFNQPLNSWNVGNVTTMNHTFYDAEAFNQPLSSWNVSKVTDMGDMFNYAYAFNQPLNNWNVSAVTTMANMFQLTKVFNQPLDNWDVSKVTDMSYMFNTASAFNQTLGSWNLTKVTNLANMLNNSGLDCPHYSATLQGWAKNSNTPSGLTLGANTLHYGVSALSAHNYLTTATASGGKGWTINGDTYDATCPGADAISGIVWDDANGNGTIESGENGTNLASGWIYLVNTAGTIVDSSTVQGTGAAQGAGYYAFYNYTPGTTYNIILNQTQYAKGATLSSSVLNTGWVNVSYNNGTATTNTTGINSVTAPASTGITTANVGAEQTPTATAVNKTVPSPQMFNLADVTGYKGITSSDSYAAPLAGTDPEDGTLGTGSTFVIQSIASTTQLYYSGTLLSAGNTITNYNPSLLKMYGSNSSNGVSFTYNAVDAAGQLSPAATYTLTAPYTLPVQYASPLAASIVTGGVQLDWTTGSEINNKGFGIQRSIDGQSFSTLSFVKSKGANGTGSGADYTYTDNTVVNGTYYYRLLQTDMDGKTTQSGVIRIYISGNGAQKLTVSPNPANSATTVSGLQVGSPVQVFSMDGCVVKSLTATSTTQQLDLSGLAAGMYIVKAMVNGVMMNVKFMVK